MRWSSEEGPSSCRLEEGGRLLRANSDASVACALDDATDADGDSDDESEEERQLRSDVRGGFSRVRSDRRRRDQGRATPLSNSGSSATAIAARARHRVCHPACNGHHAPLDPRRALRMRHSRRGVLPLLLYRRARVADGALRGPYPRRRPVRRRFVPANEPAHTWCCGVHCSATYRKAPRAQISADTWKPVEASKHGGLPEHHRRVQ
mmetsp:Transcript_32386/g.80592  ORF Transcript_32386/g.80592 Transcript_32386/m.80592 type:complete len:207 (-) Transcript_32386:55-675(-)